jgi:DinB superfamily
MPRKEIDHLIAMLDEAYAGPSWHGPCLRGALRGVAARDAAWRPARGRHNIWELAVHSAYWKYAVRRRLTGEAEHTFGEHGSNWFRRPASGASGKQIEKQWRRDLAMLARMHRELCDAVLAFAPGGLDRLVRGSRYTARRSVAGAAMHDVYHAGQIQLLKRLRKR